MPRLTAAEDFGLCSPDQIEADLAEAWAAIAEGDARGQASANTVDAEGLLGRNVRQTQRS